MSRLVVVSNRVTVPETKSTGSQGGLAVALAAALRQSRGLWFGWSGGRTDAFTGQVAITRAAGVTTATIDLEDQDIDEYYNGFANWTLWPLFHYRIDLARYDRQFDEGYERVNRRFAETLAPILQPDDILWVHDYHLFLLARELRALGVTNRIGFFLHTPWPPMRLLTTLPVHKALVGALFDYDLIGFQTEEWLEAFTDYCQREADATQGDGGAITAFGHTVRAAAFPIGIDAEAFGKTARSPKSRATGKRMRTSIAGRAMIVGVDRLDYSKGLEERFLAYERFLTDNPDWQNRVFLLQIAPQSRATLGSYQEIRDRLEGHSGRINGAFAEMDWVPLRYVNRGHDRAELAGIYRSAQVGLVTPIRDGMNLVAKEYVAAQNPADPGVLILSRFAGAARQMGDALLINPYAIEEMSEAIRQGLSMDKAERKRRWENLNHNVTTCDVTRWREDFVAALNAVPHR